jgi:aminopeptidase YwaD
MNDDGSQHASELLSELCSQPDRRVGGSGNLAATRLFAKQAASCGFDVDVAELDCVDWEHGDITLSAGEETFEAFIGMYSMPFDATAPLSRASTVEEVEGSSFEGSILLLDGEIAREQFMPKNFVFFNPDGHRRAVAAIEAARPAAVIAATAKNPGLTASLYPFPLFEDADFDIPHVYMTDVEGERLARHVGKDVALAFESTRIPARAEHVVATKRGTGEGRVVVFGHVDSRQGTPGALDNATAVTAIMLLAELLEDYDGALSIELAPLNGEDYYAAPGHMAWVRENAGRFGEIVLGMNLDGMGLKDSATAVSTYECPDDIEAVVGDALARHAGMERGAPWPQSDHSIFIQNGVPALAITSAEFEWLSSEIAHTEKDVPDLVDPTKIVESAEFMRDVIMDL